MAFTIPAQTPSVNPKSSALMTTGIILALRSSKKQLWAPGQLQRSSSRADWWVRLNELSRSRHTLTEPPIKRSQPVGDHPPRSDQIAPRGLNRCHLRPAERPVWLAHSDILKSGPFQSIAVQGVAPIEHERIVHHRS